MEEYVRKISGRKKWYDKYLPFVARSPEMQIEWLSKRLAILRDRGQNSLTGLSKDEITPYIKLFLESNSSIGGGGAIFGYEEGEPIQEMFKKMPDDLLPLFVECTDIYDVPKLFQIICKPSKELAMVALKKIPPPYEKNPLLVIDRVFHSINEAGKGLFECAAESVLASEDKPDRFSENYERFKEIMMDEHILGMLYPKAK